MAKYIVKKDFIDKETKEKYNTGDEITLTVKRGDEILASAELAYVERIDNKDEEEVEEIVEEVKEDK